MILLRYQMRSEDYLYTVQDIKERKGILMKNIKKILLFTLIPILFIGIFVYIHFILREKPIISSPYTVAEVTRTVTEGGFTCEVKSTSDNWVALTDVSYEGKDITDKVDASEFIKHLSTSMCKRTFKTYSPYNGSDVTWEIDLIWNNNPMHILLGNINIWYESANKGYYEILDADLLKQVLEKMVSQN